MEYCTPPHQHNIHLSLPRRKLPISCVPKIPNIKVIYPLWCHQWPISHRSCCKQEFLALGWYKILCCPRFIFFCHHWRLLLRMELFIIWWLCYIYLVLFMVTCILDLPAFLEWVSDSNLVTVPIWAIAKINTLNPNHRLSPQNPSSVFQSVVCFQTTEV